MSWVTIMLVGSLQFLGCNNPGNEPAATSSTDSQNVDLPDSTRTIFDLALAWAEKGDKRVVPLCDSLLKLKNDQIGAAPFYYLGIFYAQRGDTTQALHYFDRTIITDYNFLEAYIEKAALLLALKKPAEAQKELALLRAIAPTYAPGHYWIGKVAEAQEQKEKAIYQYQLALSLDSTLVQAKQALSRLQK